MKKQILKFINIDTPELLIGLLPSVLALYKKNPNLEIKIETSNEVAPLKALLPQLSDCFQSSSSQEAPGIEFTVDLNKPVNDQNPFINSHWHAYLKTVHSNPKLLNPFHIVDLLSRVCQVQDNDWDFELSPYFSDSEALKILGEKNRLRIAICLDEIHPAVLNELKQGLISARAFAEIIIINSKQNSEKQFLDLSTSPDEDVRVIDLREELSILDTAALLYSSDLFLGAPSIFSILSSGFGTFSICLERNKERRYLHYPYGHGHLVLELDTVESPSSSFFEKLIQFVVFTGNGQAPEITQWQNFCDDQIESELGKFSLFLTQRIETVFNEGKHTHIDLAPLLFLGWEFEPIVTSFYRLMWEYSIENRVFSSAPFDLLHETTMPKFRELLKPLEQLYELATFGAKYSNSVREQFEKGDLAGAKQIGSNLQEIDELIHTLGEMYPALSPLSRFHAESQGLMEETTVRGLAQEMGELYTEIQDRVLVLLDLTKSLFHTTFQNESTLNTAIANKGDIHG